MSRRCANSRHPHRGELAGGRAVQRLGSGLDAADADWHSESLLTIEFSNVMATLIRRMSFPFADASATLAEAVQFLNAGLHQVAGSDALDAAAHFGVTAYNARFLLVARALGSPLIAEDA